MNEIINLNEFENLHESEGYFHVATIPILIPWYQCSLKCKCTKECAMSPVDRIICKCLISGIDTIEDISFVLALDKSMIVSIVKQLEQVKVVECNEKTISLTQYGKEAYEKQCREKVYEELVEIYVNGITGEYSVYEDIQDCIVRSVENDNYRLIPFKTVIKMDIENDDKVRNLLKVKAGMQIISTVLNKHMPTVYKKEFLLVYKKDDDRRILMEMYDESKGQLDISLASELSKIYNKRALIELLNIENIVEEHKKHILENNEIAAGYSNKILEHKYLRNKEIREMFKNVFEKAQKSICIISPWIDNKNYVITDDFLDKMEKALSIRNLEIVIGYGYVSKEVMEKKKAYYRNNPNPKEIERDKDWNTELAAQKLRERFGNYEKFSMTYIGTHEKILCIDDKYTLIGSYNLLSYDGGEKDKYKGIKFRFEGGVLIEDDELAMYIKGLIKDSNK